MILSLRHRLFCINNIVLWASSVKSSNSKSASIWLLSTVIAASSVLYTNWLASENSAASIAILLFMVDDTNIKLAKKKVFV